MDSRQIIELLSLKPLSIEGGYFRETYRCAESSSGGKERAASTAIFYLLDERTVSRIHRLRSDEIWHFYIGDPVELYLFKESGVCEKKILGTAIDRGQSPQILVSKECWQGARLKDGGKFALMGTTVAPGFDEADFEAGKRGELLAAYPGCEEIINILT